MELLTEAASHRGLMYATFPDLTLPVPIMQAIGAGDETGELAGFTHKTKWMWEWSSL